MNRIETKFLLDFAQYQYLRERCQMLFQSDGHTKQANSYPIISAYFDTPDLKFFYQKINGEFYHTKIRLRCYGNKFQSESNCFLEVKAKANENQTKIRIPIVYDRKMLDPANWVDIKNDQIDQILVNESNLIHVTNAYYEREAYEWHSLEEGRVRVNFDFNFAALPKSQFHATRDAVDANRLLPQDKIICEIKTPTLKIPELLQKELKAIGAEQRRISKYAEAIMSINDRLNLNEAIA